MDVSQSAMQLFLLVLVLVAFSGLTLSENLSTVTPSSRETEESVKGSTSPAPSEDSVSATMPNSTIGPGRTSYVDELTTVAVTNLDTTVVPSEATQPTSVNPGTNLPTFPREFDDLDTEEMTTFSTDGGLFEVTSAEVVDSSRTAPIDQPDTRETMPPSTTRKNGPRIIPWPGSRKNFTMTLSMSGNCEQIGDEKDFMESLKEELINHLRSEYQGKVFRLFPQKLRCGSVFVELIVEMEPSDMDSFQVDNRFNFTYNSVLYQTKGFSFTDELTTKATVVTVRGSETTGETDFQQTLIFIVIGSVGGSFILLSFFLLCQYLAHKAIKTSSSKKTFRPSDEPSINLSDFNMAHTFIPRPQSIYSTTTRSSFLPYEDMGPTSYGGVTSPTPYVYADSNQIREHYQEVVERDPVTPTSKTINDFGRSGIPSWDLPVLEGVVQEEDSASTLRIDDRPTSSTFHAPPEGTVVPPPPDSSPPPPPRDKPSPLQQREEGAPSIKSEDGSSHTELSIGDTRQLIRAQNHDVGIDNPAMDIDQAYF